MIATHGTERRLKVAFSAIGAAVVVIGMAASVGWLATLGKPEYVAIPVIALIGLFVATRPVLLFWASVYGGLLVAGITRLYIPQLQLVRWLLAPISLLFLAHVVIENMGNRHRWSLAEVPQVVWWGLAFIAAALFASLTANFELKRFIIGFKGYFQVWGLLFGMAFVCCSASRIDRLPRVFLAIALIQIPFVAHQFLILVPERVGLAKGIVPVDVVAGTFGASFAGGGANALLNAFLMIVLAGLVAARQTGAIPAWRMWVLGAVLLVPVLINMAKVSVFYLLAVFLVLYARDMVQKPLRFMLAGLAASGLLGLLMAAFVLNAPSEADVESWQDLIRYTYEYNLESDETGEQLSRGGALDFWATRHGTSDLWGTLFGHGIGYTRIEDGRAAQEGATRFSTPTGIPEYIDLESNIGNTAIAALIWETGLLGLVCVLGMLLATFLAAGRLAKLHKDNPERAAALRAVQVAMVITVVTLFHKNLFVLDVVYQTLVALMIGYVAYWDRQARSSNSFVESGQRTGATTRMSSGPTTS